MKEDLIEYISEELLDGEVRISPDEDLHTSGLIDSLALMRLIAYIEKKFDVKVPPEDLTIENFESVEAIGGYLKGILDNGQ